MNAGATPLTVMKTFKNTDNISCSHGYRLFGELACVGKGIHKRRGVCQNDVAEAPTEEKKKSLMSRGAGAI